MSDIRKIFFNKKGYPTKAIITNNNFGKSEVIVNIEYKDELISQIKTKNINTKNAFEEVTNIYFNKQNLITNNQSSFLFYSLNSLFLEYKGYYPIDRNYEFLTFQSEFKEPNKIFYKEFSGQNNSIIEFNSLNSFFPITYTINFEKGDDSKKTEVLSKSDNLNYLYTSNNLPNCKIRYLNKNLISEITIFKEYDANKKIKDQYKFDFNYEYYK